ncbi:MAG: T9SS type A sorting domain-containing protein [Bacteroidetes bacterium]|nr:T9SS type A sorting domain-containing protein [Bacteroidota bacterium]
MSPKSNDIILAQDVSVEEEKPQLMSFEQHEDLIIVNHNYVTNPGSNDVVIIADGFGRRLDMKPISGNTTMIGTKSLEKGMYFLIFYYKGEMTTEKIILK